MFATNANTQPALFFFWQRVRPSFLYLSCQDTSTSLTSVRRLAAIAPRSRRELKKKKKKEGKKNSRSSAGQLYFRASLYRAYIEDFNNRRRFYDREIVQARCIRLLQRWDCASLKVILIPRCTPWSSSLNHFLEFSTCFTFFLFFLFFSLSLYWRVRAKFNYVFRWLLKIRKTLKIENGFNLIAGISITLDSADFELLIDKYW